MAERDNRPRLEQLDTLRTPGLILLFAVIAFYLSHFCFPKPPRHAIFKKEPYCRECGEKGAEGKVVLYRGHSKTKKQRKQAGGEENIIIMEAHHKCYQRVAKKYGIPKCIYHHPTNGTTYCETHHDAYHNKHDRLTEEEELDQIRGLLLRVVEFHRSESPKYLRDLYQKKILLEHPDVIRNAA